MYITGNSFSRSRFPSVSASLLCLVLITGVSACGGGGGGSSNDPTLSINSPTITEGNAGTVELLFTITLDEDADSALTVDYTTSDDTATIADNDYTAVNGQLTIPEGSRTASVSVFANGDAVFEQDESFNLDISNPQGISLSQNSITGIGTVENDDDADPKGYFTGTGTFNGTDYTDVTALAFDNRVLLFSPTANVQYDLTIDPTVLDYSGGAVEVYVDGNIEQAGAITVSGTTNELQIEGTFAGGTGLGVGSFNVAFDVDNNRGATFGRIEATGIADWDGNLFGIDEDGGFFSSNNVGGYTGGDLNDERCLFPGGALATFVIPLTTVNIYQMDHSIDPEIIGTCAPPYESTGHTGFAAVVDDTGTDDKLFFAFNNDDIAIFGVMNRP